MINFLYIKILNFFVKKESKKILFILIPSVLTALLPFFLITGPFLPDLAISICGILFIANSINTSLKKYFTSKFFIFFIFFWLTLVSSSFLSDHSLYSLKTSFFYIRFGIFALSTWYLLENNKKILKYFIYCFIFCFFSLIVDGYVQFFTDYNVFGWKIIGSRISSFFKDELILGSYLSRLTPLFFSIFILLNFFNSNKFYKFIFILLLIFTEVLIFLSGERVAFFYLNLSAFYMIFLLSNYKKTRILTLIVSFILILIISSFQGQFVKRIFIQTKNQILPTSGPRMFSIEHENHYKSAILMFNENKIIGIGPKLFRKNCNKERFVTSFESCTTHPHNTYIQLLAEVGIFGFLQIFIAFLILSYFSFKHFFLKIFKNKILFTDFQIALMSCLLITLWPLAPSGNFFGNWLNVVYYLPVGFLLFSMNTKNNFYGKKIK